MTETPVPLAFLDTETIGLDPDVHGIWEVGLILRTFTNDHARSVALPQRVEREYVWQLPVDLGQADAFALNTGRFHDRRWRTPGGVELNEQIRWTMEGDWTELDNVKHPMQVPASRLAEWAARFAALTWGAHLVGAVPSFDEERLRRFLRRLGVCPGWHYHLVDVEAMAAGWLAGRAHGLAMAPISGEEMNRYGAATEAGALASPPWTSKDMSRACGVDPDGYDAHTALGDARWARDLYDAVTS